MKHLSRGGELGGEREGIVDGGIGQVVLEVLDGALSVRTTSADFTMQYFVLTKKSLRIRAG